MGQQSGQSPVHWARYLREAPLPGLFPKSLSFSSQEATRTRLTRHLGCIENGTGPNSAGAEVDDLEFQRRLQRAGHEAEAPIVVDGLDKQTHEVPSNIVSPNPVILHG